ncbi:glycosyl transferase family 1 [Candidatus Woesearchaeota archaeon]|jgi:trehalose synthase|nr:glycosyl transferase family 1 [Candidatus Woesearchaeota archaeon]|tara:strand:+ start:22885 stop:24144 length:1260 start_codon:yes stop_codon:yes gene_type:complete
MLPKIEDYEQFVGKEVIEKIKDLAVKLEDKHVVNVNSTYSGGGVAEILNSMVVLMNRLGIKTDWRLLKGTHSFFDVTKKFHNGLQGEKVSFTEKDKRIYLDELERNSLMHHFREHDLVFIHDPQPLGLIKFNVRKKQPWIWRGHLEINHANKKVWSFLKDFAKQYDGAVFSMKKYLKRDLHIPQIIVPPSIDPLSMKNKKISNSFAKKLISKEGISLNKPIITQVSRFDKWKNPLGVIQIFKKVRAKIDAQLVLMGDMASDDPEGPKIYSKVVKQAEKMKDVHIITNKDDLLVNALQSESHVVIQNSKREGFGLVVTEALWKGTPVVATKAGGIPLQVIPKKTGALIDNSTEASDWCVKLIKNDKLRERMGINAREHIRKNFLITRQLYDNLHIIDTYTTSVADDVIKAARELKRMLIR